MKYLSKKIIAAIIISLIGLSIIPKTADAAQAVIVVNPVLKVESVSGIAAAVATGATITEISFEWAFKTAKEILKKQLLDMMVDQIVAYIQGGGTPKFITDWPGFFRDAVDQASGKFLQQIGLSQLCSPFKPLLSRAFIPIPTFTERTSCTLSQVGVNIDVFLKDFRQGNWIAWQEMVLRPQNNIYGAYIMAWDQYEIEKSAAQKAAESEAQAGKGFLSVKKCLEQDEEGTCIKEEIVTPGDTVGVAVASAITSDTQWAANIQSWTAALINAVINRVIKEGVGVMKGSEESSGSSYYPSEYQSAADLEIESEKQQQINEVKKFVNEWQYLYNAKSKSLSYSEQLKVILVKIKKLNCQPAVSDSEIQAVQADIDRLKTETTELKNKIDGGNNLITKITNANTIRERTIAQQDFLAFVDKYNTLEIQTQIITGDARKAADQELATKTSDLSIAQGRLATCSISP